MKSCRFPPNSGVNIQRPESVQRRIRTSLALFVVSDDQFAAAPHRLEHPTLSTGFLHRHRHCGRGPEWQRDVTSPAAGGHPPLEPIALDYQASWKGVLDS